MHAALPRQVLASAPGAPLPPAPLTQAPRPIPSGPSGPLDTADPLAAPALPILPEALGQAVWRGSQLAGQAGPVLASGFAALDAALPGGGWPCQGLSEILQPQGGACEWRLLAPALRGLAAGAAPGRGAARPLLLIDPPRTPHLPGLVAAGLAPQQFIWLAPASPRHALWALEQAIKSNAAAAILAWLPQVRPEQLRRLQACAAGAQAPVFLFRPLEAAAQSSAAPLRLSLAPGPDWQLRVQLIKRRGPAQLDALLLPALPAALADVLAPRLLRSTAALAAPTPPTRPRPLPRHALARPAPLGAH